MVTPSQKFLPEKLKIIFFLILIKDPVSRFMSNLLRRRANKTVPTNRISNKF